MTALPTPETVALELCEFCDCFGRASFTDDDGAVHKGECGQHDNIAAAIRADRMRVLAEVEARWRNAPRGSGVIGTLHSLAREIEGAG